MLAQDVCTELETFVANAISRLVAELRLIDIGDYIAYLRMEQFRGVADLVHNAAELYFTPGYVEFAMEGEAVTEWGRAPAATLMLRINSLMGRAHVAVKLCEDHAEVRLTYVDFAESIGASPDRVRLFAEDVAANMIGARHLRFG